MAPLPADWSVGRGRDAYLAENGFTLAAYDAPWTQASFLSIDFAVPNTKPHAAAIRLHDLHHVATGFGTDLAGEGEISAWEVRGGLRGVGLYVAFIVVSGALMGLLLAPRRTLRAWHVAKTARPLWTLGVPYEELVGMSVDQLRSLVGAPAEGVVVGEQGLHKNAPKPERATGRLPSPTS
jgi:hypothetical protein